jgi:pyruvate formate lyase activating enzyme
MKFAALLKQSLVDYPGQIAAVLFTRGCNLRCPFCHNPHLLIKPGRNGAGTELQEGDALAFLQERQGFLDAVVISGGEPSLHSALPLFLQKVRKLNYLIKLDTNGTNPILLTQMLGEGLLDYVAMDIKAPLEFKSYQAACGKLSSEDFFNIRSSIQLLRQASIVVEFRSTVVPCLHRPEDIEAIARYIEGAPLYTLQQFNPKCTLEPGYGKVVPYSREEMQAIEARCSQYVKNAKFKS